MTDRDAPDDADRGGPDESDGRPPDGSDPLPPDERAATDAVQAFYGRWVRVYDLVARHTPRIRTVRRRAASACRLSPGDTVVEMGTGTGANLPYLRADVGTNGRVVGLDVTGPGLAFARRRLGVNHDPVIDLLQADAARPPVRGPVDAVVGTFVTGMFRDPVAVVDRWCDLARGGHVVLVDAAPSPRPVARPLNGAFRLFTRLSTPPTWRLRYDEDVVETLDERVTAGHQALRNRAEAVAHETHHLGFVRLTGGKIPE